MSQATGSHRPGTVFWLAFAVIFVATAAWSFASPLTSGPDENAHMVKAAAVVRGELLGEHGSGGEGADQVAVPAFYTALLSYPVCYAFQGHVPANCTPPLPSGEAAQAPSEGSTWVIRNNPLYYAVVGLPTLLPPGPVVLYLMRLVSAALSSLVLAWSFKSLAEIPRRHLVAVGMLVAVTPMVVYLNSVVNPSSLEISAALTLTVALLALVRDPDPRLLPSRAAGIAVVTVLLVNTRGLSPVYAATALVLVAVVVGPWSAFQAAVSDRRTWPWLGLVVIGTAASLAWTRYAGTLEAGGAGHPELTFLGTAKRTFLDTADFLLVYIGRFGWLDTSLPMLVYLAYLAVLAFPVLLVLVLGERRSRIAMAVVAGTAVCLPVVIHAWQARNVGYIWTGRYSMPLYVVVLVVAGFLLRDVFTKLPPGTTARVLTTFSTTVMVGIVIAFVVNLHRYTVGDIGSWHEVPTGSWSPPVPSALLLAVEALSLACGVVLLRRVCGVPEGHPHSVAINSR